MHWKEYVKTFWSEGGHSLIRSRSVLFFYKWGKYEYEE